MGNFTKPARAEVISEPPTNTGEDLKKALLSRKPVLVDFGANKCIPCRQIRPILREIDKEYKGKAHVLIIDVFEQRELARDYRIQLIPTLIFFDPSGKEVFRHVGAWDKNSMIQKLREAGVK
jgi:thioredoxin 1